MWQLLDGLRNNQTRESTKRNYKQIWKQFNLFLIRLDVRPKLWESRVALFCAYLIEKGNKSSTIRSYISAIKHMLRMDGYKWSEDEILLSTMTKACKVKNDVVYYRRPIFKSLLEILLFEFERLFCKDIYLEVLYKTILSIGYYGLFRVGELTVDQKSISNHAIKAKDVHLGKNKDKILFILHSSKTHDKESLPQKVKISANPKGRQGSSKSHFCPFRIFYDYLVLREGYEDPAEQLFIFREKIPVTPHHIRSVLKTCLRRVGLNESITVTH